MKGKSSFFWTIFVVFFVELRNVPAGMAGYVFDGRDRAGRLLPSGVYFTRVAAKGVVGTTKLVITR